ncbi:amino acid-binding protein [Haloferax mediterranei ATCC 33500]|uniref:Allosteric regulator of homoserine dehydrogenase n=2 Tax=Haloferax mediterranei (strain ATCC 33500 / DSM 1411 / JCM 8866 / NBRC 14739 / NCIMB 2177 / R-4) TaxID=523841 RepID=M0J4J8_HALMT|nr:allosteric regulator of homoserine dehydrogenase [Haloferax mediterranei ATCC 33500]QCQ74617.1 amino acid-binding protein [Haloferax mediterranei ATCC 33500]
MRRRETTAEPRVADNNVGAAHGGGTMSTQDLDGESDAETDGGGEMPKPHTVRLELVDEPGQLLAALQPIAENGGNLLSIFHERGNLTPRGHIPVEVDLECPPDRFEGIVDALRDAGVNVIRAGAEHFGEEITLLLVGDLVDSDLSDTLYRIEESADATVTDLSLSAPSGTKETSSARLRLAARSGKTSATLSVVRDIAAEKDLHVVEPLPEESA